MSFSIISVLGKHSSDKGLEECSLPKQLMRHLLGQLLRAEPGATDKTLGLATGLDIMVRLLNEILIFGGSSIRILFSISKAQPKMWLQLSM